MSFPRALLVMFLAPAASGAAYAQTGPSEPQVIAAANTAKISVGSRKLTGHAVATLKVGEDGRVRDVLVTENTTEAGFEPQLVRVFQSARFRPALDASGKPIEAAIEMKLELRSSTGPEPKPIAAKPDPQAADKEKERIRRMKCSDFVWEWDLIREEVGDAATEFMPRIATMMYVAVRNEAGAPVDAKAWKAAPKALKQSAEQCREEPQAPFWDGVFKARMDEAVSK